MHVSTDRDNAPFPNTWQSGNPCNSLPHFLCLPRKIRNENKHHCRLSSQNKTGLCQQSRPNIDATRKICISFYPTVFCWLYIGCMRILTELESWSLLSALAKHIMWHIFWKKEKEKKRKSSKNIYFLNKELIFDIKQQIINNNLKQLPMAFFRR